MKGEEAGIQTILCFSQCGLRPFQQKRTDECTACPRRPVEFLTETTFEVGISWFTAQPFLQAAPFRLLPPFMWIRLSYRIHHGISVLLVLKDAPPSFKLSLELGLKSCRLSSQNLYISSYNTGDDSAGGRAVPDGTALYFLLSRWLSLQSLCCMPKTALVRKTFWVCHCGFYKDRLILSFTEAAKRRH